MTKTSIVEITDELMRFWIDVFEDSDGYWSVQRFVYSTLPFSFLSRNYPFLTISESWDIVCTLRVMYEGDCMDYTDYMESIGKEK